MGMIDEDPIYVMGYNRGFKNVLSSKAEHENCLKVDIVAMLEEIKKEMNPIKECEYQIYGKEHWNFVGKCQDVVQQKINTLKAEREVEDGNDD